MAWFRVQLSEEEIRIVTEEREFHPRQQVRRRMLVLWSLHCGLTREAAARVANVGVATVGRYVRAYREGGLDGLRRWEAHRPRGEMASWREIIRESFEQQPVSTIAQACERIEQLTGLKRGKTQVRLFLKGMGLKWQRMRAIPVPPKKTSPNMSRSNRSFSKPN